MNRGSGEIVEALWRSMAAREWEAAGRLLADDVEVYWPHTGETINGREDYIAINREYPEGWSIQLVRVLAAGADAALEARVPHQTLGLSFVAGFYRVNDGLISGGTEYWIDEGSQNPPDWRRRYVNRPGG
jgi:limonene-1,2-epoxide hydrolase